MRPSYRKRLSLLTVWIILIRAITAYGQDVVSKAWDTNPKAYIQSKAVQSSVDQNLIQDSLELEKTKLRGLETRLSKTTVSHSANILKAEIKQSRIKIKDLQTRLTDKIIQGKAYKEMMPLSDDEIRQRLTASNGKVPVPLTKGDSSARANPNVNAPQPKIQVQGTADNNSKSEPAGPASEKPSLQNFDPWAGVSSPDARIRVPCQFQDPPEGSARKGLALYPEVLFKYTPEEIKKYLRGQSYVTGEGFIATEPGFIFLQLRLNIASDQALKSYGNLEKSILVVYFVNGKELKLINSRYDAGYVDPVRKMTSMTGVYYLEKPMVKMLMSSEVDKIRLNFASGYEDYVVYNIDFFTRQLACINASK